MDNLFDPFTYCHHPWANRTVQWFPSDDLITFQNNLATNKDLLEKYGWIEKIFNYKFNRQGFRSQELDTGKPLLVLGCSYTMGVGLPLEYTWPHIVAEKLNFDYYNLSVGSCSNDTTFKLATHYVPSLRPKVVIVLSPEVEHIELIDRNNKEVKRFFPRAIKEKPLDHDMAFYKRWINDPINGHLNREKNQLAIKQICESNNIKCVILDHMELRRDLDLARDLQHPGILAQQELSDKILSQV